MPFIVQEDLEILARLKLTNMDVWLLGTILKPLHDTARLYATRFVITALRRKKCFEETLRSLLVAWDETWREGTPGRLGDPDDTGTDAYGRTWGWQNVLAMHSCYTRLGLHPPKFLF